MQAPRQPQVALPVFLVAVSVLLAAVGVGLVVGAGVPLTDHQFFVSDVINSLVWPVLAALVLRRQPGNLLAWLFVVIGLSQALFVGGTETARYLWTNDPGNSVAPWFALAGEAASNLGWPALWIVPQLYPNGRPLPGYWRVHFRLTAVAYLLLLVADTLTPGRPESYWPRDNPIGVLPQSGLAHGVGSAIGAVVFVGLIIVGGLATTVLRYVRSKGLERQQLKAFVVATAALPPIGLLASALPHSWVLITVATTALPVAWGLALFRYRLYDIDRVVSRTVSYAIVTGLLVGVYVGCIALTTRLLSLSSSFGVAATTLLAAALFQPLRRRVQFAVDRRFNRSRYDATRTVEAFADRLRTEVALDSLQSDLAGTVADSLQPDRVWVWLADAQSVGELERVSQGDAAVRHVEHDRLVPSQRRDEVAVERHEIHATALIERDRADVVVGGDQPQPAPALDGESLDRRNVWPSSR